MDTRSISGSYCPSVLLYYDHRIELVRLIRAGESFPSRRLGRMPGRSSNSDELDERKQPWHFLNSETAKFSGRLRRDIITYCVQSAAFLLLNACVDTRCGEA